MFDIKTLRENPELVRENQKNRYCDVNIVDEILEKDEQFRKYLFNYDKMTIIWKNVRKFIKNANGQDELGENSIKDIVDTIEREGNYDQLKKYGKKDIINILNTISISRDDYESKYKESRELRDSLISRLGNKLANFAYIGNNEENNPIVFVYNGKLPDNIKLKTHIELCEESGVVDYSRGVDIAGNRGYFLKHNGLILNNAIKQYAIDFLIDRNYEMFQTPHFMTYESISNVSQLSEFEETLYKLEGYDKYLIATSEQPMTAYCRSTKYNLKDLPLKRAGLSYCFRKEVGAHSKDTRGIFRVHEFEKMEQFALVDADRSDQVFNEFVETVKDFYKSLGICFRIVNIASGALNNSAAVKYDLEAYFPGSNNYKELVSCSNCTDFFSRKIAAKDNNGKYIHMLNSTLYANTRTIACLLETWQTDEGVLIPEPLRKYTAGKFRGNYFH